MKVYLPLDLEREITNLTNQENEVEGLLITRMAGEDEYIITFYIIGRGGPGYVSGDEHEIKKVRALLDSDENLGIIPFHTHARGTISRYGEHFERNFSQGDMNALEKNAQAYGIPFDKNYFEYLFTPTFVNNTKGDNSLDPISKDWQTVDGKSWQDVRAGLDAKLARM